MLAELLGPGLSDSDSDGTLECGWTIPTPGYAGLADCPDSVLLHGEPDSPAAGVPHGLFAPRQTPYHAALTGQLAFAVGIPLGSAQSGRSPHPAFRPTTFGQRAGVAIVPDYLRVAVAAGT